MIIRIGMFLCILLLAMSIINGSVQENQSGEQEKIEGLIKKLRRLRYGDWGSLSDEIRAIGDPIIKALIKMLRHEDTSVWSQYQIEWHHRRVAWALGQLRSEKSIEILIEMVQDRTLHDYGRYEAAMALRRIKAEQAIDPLIEVLSDRESNPPPRFAAAYALDDLGSVEAVPS